MAYDLTNLQYEQIQADGCDRVGETAQQHWDIADAKGEVFARAEIFEGSEQWGVRLRDRAPEIPDAALVKTLAQLLVWHAGCRSETVDVVLSRNHEHHTLVRVGGDYV